MKSLLTLLILLTINKPGVAQHKIIWKIELDSFSNQTAMDMGMAIINMAKNRKQHVAVEISRLTHTVFLYVDDSLTSDKLNWLRRKANVAKRFEESSLSVKRDLLEGKMTLDKTFGLDEKDFLARGGAIPIFVKGAGMIAVIAVSGLHDEEDHKIIIEALKQKYLKADQGHD
jgi:uncharacterized protein (UPF0303 family)